MPSYRFGQSDSGWDEEKKQNRLLRALLHRSWFLFIPLIGIWYSSARQVDPLARKLDEEISKERVTLEQARTRSLAEARQVGVKVSRLKAVRDTFEVRFTQISEIMDSLRILTAIDQKEIEFLEGQAESLRGAYAESEIKAQEHSGTLIVLQQQVDSLRAVIAARREQSDRLRGEASVDEDLADRIVRPDLYRKNSALMTGEGSFPQRDALPKR